MGRENGELPFAGDYPTEAEAFEALKLIGKGDDAGTVVRGEMGGQPVEGKLVELIPQCPSEHLLRNWPMGLRLVTAGLLAQRAEREN